METEDYLKSYRYIALLFECERERIEKETYRTWFALRGSGDKKDLDAAQRVSDLGNRETAKINQIDKHFQEFVKSWAREKYTDPDMLEFWNAKK